MTLMTAIGLMSGTSLDGVEAALLRTDGESVVEAGEALSLPYDPTVRAGLARAVKAAIEGRRTASDIGLAAADLVRVHARAVGMLLMKSGVERISVDIVGFHGQTLLHRPAQGPGAVGRSWQIGDGAALATAIGINVVNDFRSADIAAGGQGAPLAPVYHHARVAAAGLSGVTAVVNIGGVANVTFVEADAAPEALVAFDCGPGNGLIDQWMHLKTGAAFDADGAAGLSGEVSEVVVAGLLGRDYFRRPPPKSLDRYDFSLDPIRGLSVADGAATLAAFTSSAIAGAARFAPSEPARWIICGGGRRNNAIMKGLAAAATAPVLAAEAVGWRGESLEAESFAYLAVRSLKGLPLSFPGTTGAPRPINGGALNRAPNRTEND